MTHAVQETCRRIAVRRGRLLRHSRGLSLLEVLVSMFVLLFGLLGVAALFPLGQFNVSRASRYDRAAAIGQSAFNEIKVRGLLRPYDPPGQQWTVSPGSPPRAQFDPLGTFATTGLPKVTLPGLVSASPPSNSAAWHVFVSRDDLTTDLPPDRSFPAVQIFTQSRGYSGHYSWMFTVAPSETGSEFLVVSVPVFYRRNPANEFIVGAGVNSGGFNGGTMTFNCTAAQANVIKPGCWFLFSRSTSGAPASLNPQPYYRWFQVDSFRYDQVTTVGTLTYSGPSYDTTNAGNTPLLLTFYDSVVAVYEKLIRVEGTTDWSW